MSPVANGSSNIKSNGKHSNGSLSATKQKPAELDASKLIINRAKVLKEIPEVEALQFGQTMTDHMLVADYDPVTGWSAPVIQPYQPLQLDPASSCFQYCPNVFEGMKAYLGPDGTPRLFRPELNMARLKSSVARVALPTFDENALLELIKTLVSLEKRWIPNLPGYSLYIRPTVIGTRASIKVGASDRAMIYIIMCPAGPYFSAGAKGISLLAHYENVRSWPGGTGGFKLGLNYAPCFEPQLRAAEMGYDQILWLLGDDHRVTEAGAMNFFVAIKRKDGDLDIVTPPLDGTILPGITRASVIALAQSHNAETPLPGLPASLKLHTHERRLTMEELVELSYNGLLVEAFCVGTAVLVVPVSKIGYDNHEILMPKHADQGPNVANALLQRISEIQTGRSEFEGWSVPCEG